MNNKQSKKTSIPLRTKSLEDTQGEDYVYYNDYKDEREVRDMFKETFNNSKTLSEGWDL